MENTSHRPGWTAYLPNLLALASIIAASAWIVWAINAQLGWPAKVLHVLGAGLVAFLVAGSIGVEAINIFATLALLSLVTEGLILGGRHFGWPGAVLGVVVGILLAPFVAIAATVLLVALAYLGSSSPTEVHAPVDPPGATPGPEPEAGSGPETPDRGVSPE